MHAGDWLEDTRTSYDRVAESYADLVRGSLSTQPHLSGALRTFAEILQDDGGGSVSDLGCGSGEVTAALRNLGVDVWGLDISPAMVEVARRDHPEVSFEVGTMTKLDVATGSMAGLLAWQSLIHVPDRELPVVLDEFKRVLAPGGHLQLVFHVGTGSELKTEGYGGHPMHVVVHRRQLDDVAVMLRETGFAVGAHTLVHLSASASCAILFARRSSD